MQCRSCQATLAPGTTTCPKCGYILISTTDSYDDALAYVERVPYTEQAVPQNAPSPLTTPQNIVAAKAEPYIATPIPPERRTGTPAWMIALLVLLALLLILGSGGFIAYAVASRPGEFHAQATAVAQGFLTAQVQGKAQGTENANATANALTPDQLYQQVTSATPVIDDPLKDASGNVWYDYGKDARDNCNFSAGAYHVHRPDQGGSDCIGASTQFDNLAYQVQMKVIKGVTGGLMFRVSNLNGTFTFYGFEISISGEYVFFAATSSTQARYLKQGSSSAIRTGLGQSNTVTVIARGSHMYLYINGETINTVVDTAYTAGQIALIAEGNAGGSDVAFNNVKVWAL